MGEQGYFRDAIRQVMASQDAKEFRKEFKKARDMNMAPNLKDFRQIHYYLDSALRSSMRMAEANLSNRDGVYQKTYQNEVLENFMKVGDLDGAQQFLNDMKQTMSY